MLRTEEDNIRDYNRITFLHSIQSIDIDYFISWRGAMGRQRAYSVTDND